MIYTKFENINKKYDIIYADPPWKYDKSLNYKGIHGDVKHIDNYYNQMDINEIKKMNINSISKDNCWLILWTTVPKIREGLEVLESWGFKYRTSAIWDKEELGMGWFFRIQHEIILIGIKGNPKKPNIKERSIFREKRTIHSKKPNCVKDWINKAFKDMDKIELFSRQEIYGWDSFGNEVEPCNYKIKKEILKLLEE